MVATGIEVPNAALALRMTRRRRLGPAGRWTVEVIYAITDLSWHQITPAQLAEAMRAHWAIENQLHWIRNVTFAEDHCPAAELARVDPSRPRSAAGAG